METGSTSDDVWTDRLQRFADWGHVQQSPDERGRAKELELESFYYGNAVAERTRVVRGAIEYVRRNWQDYGRLMEGLRALLKKRLGDPLPAGDIADLERLLSSSKEWNEQRGGHNVDDYYSAIRLYASDFGHKNIFSIVDTIIRTNTINSEQEEMNTAVFLVELVNVDLFNYVSVTPHANNFQGVVFRGLLASDEQLRSFKELAARPIEERYWAVPLALVSSSRSQETAVAYAKGEAQGQLEKHLFLWRIHVVELETELVQLYQERFPSSVVSTICAVPIRELSQFPEEDEVVLRGPFFQLIRMQEEFIKEVGNIQVMDSVMLTINRDHPSTMELNQTQGDHARELMACLVGIGRARACKRLAEGYGMLEDVSIYDQLIQKGLERLEAL
ncbi:hypothetical protein H0H87_002523 [Tephrocybe sp. NHM501043]|nr:hypothetical protein H0H87_002523 [Tephrocybe sp. NHM501043]